ncbi:TCF4 [Cordylochernes scorpioides]|uniref:TCF4 n=1 Tax=Cordylochernes scorpioides TaxID=51811 RepID=A0ABY6KK34_9ARAC|nr:TCF4 [Cordylochernes scorpioides]
MRCWTVRDDPNLLQRVITGDEAWVYGYDVETKAQSSQWKLPHEPRPKKARQVRSNVKVLLTVFFDCRGVVHHEFLSQGRTVNKEYYLQVMRNLREAIRQKRPDLWKNKNWLLHHDNAPASLLVRDFLAKNNTLMMPQPPYSPDLAPYFLDTAEGHLLTIEFVDGAGFRRHGKPRTVNNTCHKDRYHASMESILRGALIRLTELEPYGVSSEGYEQERYTSPKPPPPLYADGGFYMDGGGGTTAPNLPPQASFSTMHLPPEAMPFPPGHDPAGSLLPNSLPPMSTFRGPSIHPPTSYGGQSSGERPGGGDALGKAIASIYSAADHNTNSSFSSTPSSPVGSPQPAISHWPRGASQQSSYPDPPAPLHTLQPMEENLVDAITILRHHAEGKQPPGGPQTVPSSVDGPQHNGGLLGYPLDPHLGASPSSSLPGRSSLPGSHYGFSDTDGSPAGLKLDKDGLDKDLLRGKLSGSNSSSPAPHKAAKRARSHSADEDDPPEMKAEREKERRQANNARERIRVRDINEAFKELGRMCMVHVKGGDKAQTKLNILHQAVEVITNLEQQVRERNLNPKAACLKRREEEKSEEGPKLGGPHPHLLDPLHPPHQRLTSPLPPCPSLGPGTL